eukprot:9308959-Ditylum_brightwellii.AAC.1
MTRWYTRSTLIAWGLPADAQMVFFYCIFLMGKGVVNGDYCRVEHFVKVAYCISSIFSWFCPVGVGWIIVIVVANQALIVM